MEFGKLLGSEGGAEIRVARLKQVPSPGFDLIGQLMIARLAAPARYEARGAVPAIGADEPSNMAGGKGEGFSGPTLVDALIFDSLQDLGASEFLVAHSNSVAHISAPSPDLKIMTSISRKGTF